MGEMAKSSIDDARCFNGRTLVYQLHSAKRWGGNGLRAGGSNASKALRRQPARRFAA
jgi:hypothetical protein